MSGCCILIRYLKVIFNLDEASNERTPKTIFQTKIAEKGENLGPKSFYCLNATSWLWNILFATDEPLDDFFLKDLFHSTYLWPILSPQR